jgi:ribosomal protein S17
MAKKELIGKVVSNAMQKTIRVQVEHIRPQPLKGKVRNGKCISFDETNNSFYMYLF